MASTRYVLRDLAAAASIVRDDGWQVIKAGHVLVDQNHGPLPGEFNQRARQHSRTRQVDDPAQALASQQPAIGRVAVRCRLRCAQDDQPVIVGNNLLDTFNQQREELIGQLGNNQTDVRRGPLL